MKKVLLGFFLLAACQTPAPIATDSNVPPTDEPLPITEEAVPTTDEPLPMTEETVPTTSQVLKGTMAQYVYEIKDWPLVEGKFPLASESCPYEEWLLDIDEANYYADINCRGWEGGAHAAVFIQPDGGHLLAVTVLQCGPMCHQDLFFFEKSEEEWADVTEEVFPAFSQKELEAVVQEFATEEGNFAGLYILPHFGTDIAFINQYAEVEESLYVFHWKNGLFVREKVK